MPVVNPGIRRFLGSAIQRLFNSASFYATLTHSLVPERGTGSPTFTRATTATVRDNEGVLRTAIAGEARFEGARRVRNWIQSPTENWANAGWVKTNMTVSGNRLTATGANASIYDNLALGMGTERTALASITLSRVTGTGNIDISTNGGTTWTTVSVTGARVSVSLTGNINGQLAIRIVTSGDAIDATYPQLEDVTAQTTQTAGEYVSVGVESAPYYHGSMVDGVKCFPTDLSGNPLPTAYAYDAVSLNGVAGTYVSTPDSVAASITGSHAIVVKANLADWTPATDMVLLSKQGTGTTRSYSLVVTATTGVLVTVNSLDGTTTNLGTSSVAPTVSNGSDLWCAWARNSITGSGTFWASTDGASWTQLGTAVATTAGAMFDSNSAVEIGAVFLGTALPLNGRVSVARVYNGIPTFLGGTSGTLVVDFDASRYAGGTTLTGSTGETWTLNGNAVIHPTNSPMLGYQAEGARTNLCLQSQTLGTTWADDASTSVTADQYVAPDGTTTMDKVTSLAGTSQHYLKQGITFSAGVTTYSFYLRYVNNQWCALVMSNGGGLLAASFDLLNGVVGALGAGTTSTIQATAIADVYRVSITGTMSAGAGYLFISPNSTDTASIQNYTAAGTETVGAWGAQLELGSFATPYIPTTTVAVARNADVDQYPTTAGPIAAAGSIALDFTPYHAPSGTIALWGTYVDASNYTAILHDATNLIFRKRIAGSNYDATIANAFVSGTTYKVAATWGAAGTAIYLDGVAGTPHANTTAAQIAATMQVGADGNSLQQPGAGTTNLRIWQRQLSSPEGVAVTS